MNKKMVAALSSAGMIYLGTAASVTIHTVNGLSDNDEQAEKPRLIVVPPELRVPSLDVVQSFATPGSQPSGLVFANGALWHADRGDDRIYELSSSDGSVVSSFAAPGSSPVGLGFDGTSLWNVDAVTDQLYQLDTTGQLITSFSLPADISGAFRNPSPEGLTYKDGHLWLADLLDERIYELTPTGVVAGSFATPGAWSRGLTFDGQSFWHADQGAQRIYQLDGNTGAVLDEFVTPGIAPAGLAFDGTSLWHTDSGSRRVYQLQRTTLAAGEQKDVVFTLSNSETGSLQVSALSLSGVDAAEFAIVNDACSGQSLLNGESCTMTIRFSPLSNGEKSAALNITSNDFKTEVTQVTLGGTVGDSGRDVALPVAAASAATGLWWNPDRAGQGYSLHTAGDQIALVWYTYREDGTPIWYLATGPVSGASWQADLNQYQWDPEQLTATATAIGSASLVFSSTAEARFDWQIGSQSGQETIELFEIAQAAVNAGKTGLLFDESQPGWGWSVFTQGNQEASAVYFYDTAGTPRWAFGGNAGVTTNEYNVSVFRGACPYCVMTAATPSAAGSIQRTFNDAGAAELSTDIRLPAPLDGEWLRSQIAVSKIDR